MADAGPHCKMNDIAKDGARTPCQETGVYRTEFTDCASCRKHRGSLWCVGHMVCVAHTAKLRAGKYGFTDEPVDAVVGRMRAEYTR
jgi:hypothetical protein